MKKIFTELFSFRMTATEYAGINRMCELRNITRSEFIRQLIKAELKKEENEQKQECI